MADIQVEYVGKGKDEVKFSSRWWKQKADEIHTHVFGVLKTLEERQSYRKTQNLKHARLYSNLDILGVYAGIYQPTSNDYMLPNRVTLNVVKSCVDTVSSKIAKTKPRPLFLTEGGNWQLQQKAKNLTKFLDGSFDSMNIYEEKQASFQSGAVFGTGGIKFIKDIQRKQVTCERVLIDEILVDDLEAIYGKPRSLYQTRLVSRDILKEMVEKKHHASIDAASNGLPAGVANGAVVKDLVRVVEAWHLQSGPEAGDGMHTMCIENATLSVEKWEKDYFPFVWDKWNPKLLGFFGMGLAEELTGIQLEINKILRNIQLSMHLVAVPRLLVDASSQVNTQHLNNDIGSIIKWAGGGSTPPTVITPQAMSPDVYQHLWSLYQRAFEITGISQLSAMSKKPEGLNSGVALREFQDIESDRFQITGQKWEYGFLDSAKIVIDLTKDLSKEVKGVKVKVQSDGSMKTINFSDVNLEEEKYLMRVFPTSILPTQPAGKLQKVTELIQAGFIDKETGFDLLDFPDLESATNMALAPKKIIMKMLNKIVEDGVYETPEPYMNLMLTEQTAQNFYLKAKIDGVPEDRLELIRRYMTDCKMLQDKAMQAQQAMMQPPGGMPPGQPMAAPQAQPVSDILPVGPQQ
jgi:hypothetical protein